MYKKEIVEQHEKGFHKVIRQAGFFVKDLDLGLFDLFKEVNDGVLLDEEEISTKEETTDEEKGAEEQGNDAQVQVAFFSTLLDFGRIGLVMMTIIIFLQCTCFTFC